MEVCGHLTWLAFAPSPITLFFLSFGLLDCCSFFFLPCLSLVSLLRAYPGGVLFPCPIIPHPTVLLRRLAVFVDCMWVRRLSNHLHQHNHHCHHYHLRRCRHRRHRRHRHDRGHIFQSSSLDFFCGLFLHPRFSALADDTPALRMAIHRLGLDYIPANIHADIPGSQVSLVTARSCNAGVVIAWRIGVLHDDFNF